jgi:hypothetical protein
MKNCFVKDDTMKQWLIEDATVIELLVKNGFVCKKDTDLPKMDGLDRHTIKRIKEHCANSKWYFTDCEIKFNKSYELPDGSVIASRGTSLVVVRR